MAGRRALLRSREIYVYNGSYPQRFIQVPILTWDEIRFRAAVLSVAVPVAFGAGFAAVYLIRGGVR